MIKVIVKTNTTRKEVIVDKAKTPNSIFEEMGVSTSGSTVNLNGSFLTNTQLGHSFETLGYGDGSVVNLNSIVKADGAR